MSFKWSVAWRIQFHLRSYRKAFSNLGVCTSRCFGMTRECAKENLKGYLRSLKITRVVTFVFSWVMKSLWYGTTQTLKPSKPLKKPLEKAPETKPWKQKFDLQESEKQWKGKWKSRCLETPLIPIWGSLSCRKWHPDKRQDDTPEVW